mmetsp:Transcript_18950/g.64046  ORF Transcript_18950/g.64046 Transcript_18950/m.64046 type:complete len:206 (+) Transcript_18950:166-783(+)
MTKPSWWSPRSMRPPQTKAPVSPTSRQCCKTASAWWGLTTRIIPIPQLNVRSTSESGRSPQLWRSHWKSGGSLKGRIVAAKCFGSTRGRFSERPPPVICAAPSSGREASFITLSTALTYKRVGASSAWAMVTSAAPKAAPNVSAVEALSTSEVPRRATARRTSEKPLAWTPSLGSAMRTSPGDMSSLRGKMSPRRTAPTQNPATS